MFSENRKRNVMVSVIIPAHNEAAGIEHAANEILKVLGVCEVSYELIIVDDGSRDETFERVSALEQIHKGVKGIRLSRNFGKEAAMLAGLRASAGSSVITMDADLQHPPSLIPELLAKWREGFKVVHAVKRDRSGEKKLVRLRAAVFNTLITRLGGIDMKHSSDFKLLDRVVVDVFVRRLPEKRRFYRGLAEWMGFEQADVSFSVAERNAGESKWSMGALIDLAATAIVSFTSAPLRIVSMLGIITLLFGTVVAGDALVSWVRGKSVSGFVTIIMTLLIIGSFIMISLGIVGEYIAKIYDEIKGRPSYLVSERCGFEDSEDTKL